MAGVLCREADMKIDELGEPEVRRVLAWVRFLLVTLRCSQWTVLLEAECLPEPGEDEDYVHACVHTHTEHNVAVLQLGHKWAAVSDGERRHTLLHEMLHLTTKETDRIASAWMSNVKEGGAGFALVQFSEAVERWVDHMAFCLAPFLPQYDADLLLEDENVGSDLRVARLSEFWGPDDAGH